MSLPGWMQNPTLRRLALVPPALLMLIVGVRFTVPVEAWAAPVSQGPVFVDVRGTGTLESVQEVPLAFKVGGRLLELPMEEGSRITKGQLLGRLDPQELQAQWRVALATRGSAQAGIGKAQADLAQAQATLQRARGDFDRVKRLQAEGVISRADLDAALEKLKVTEAGVHAVGAMGAQAQGGAQAAQGTEALQRLAFEEARLLSPVDGLLTRRLREPGHILAAGTPVLTVVSTRKLWVRAWVDERALGQLKVGQPAGVELRSHPGQHFKGRVDRIGRQSDRQTHELLVDVELLELPSLFAVGQRADVQIHVSGVGTALRIPTVFAQPDGSVAVLRQGRVRKVRPEVGLRGSDFVEIKEGLAEGDQVLRPRRAEVALGAWRRVKVQEAP